MKIVISLLFFAFATSLTAQVHLEDLSGNWKVISFTQKGASVSTNAVEFRYSFSDVGDFIFEQIYKKGNAEHCVCTSMITPSGGNKYYHDYLMSSKEDDKTCVFWVPGEYSYELKSGTLTISNADDKLVLQRK